MKTRLVTTLPLTESTVADGNWYPGRQGASIDRIVIHTAVGTIKSADSRFNTTGTQVSAHYGVEEDGTITHWVDEENTAYANGVWQMNLRALSIEHGDHGDYNGTRPDVLYNASGQLVADLAQFYGIPVDRAHIIKHSEVPYPTGCCDGLDIDRIVEIAKNLLSGKNSEQQPQSVTIQSAVFTMLVQKATQWDQVYTYLTTSGFMPDQYKESPVGAEKAIEGIKQIQTAYQIRKTLVDSGKASTVPDVSSSTPALQPITPQPDPISTQVLANPQPTTDPGLGVYREIWSYLVKFVTLGKVVVWK